MALSNAPYSFHSIIEDNNDEQVGSLAIELMNSDLPTRQLNQVQALMSTHENLQPTLQTLVNTSPLIERINNHSGANLDTIVDSVDSIRCIGRIYRSLQNESLPQEVVEVINTEGRNVVTNLFNIFSRTTREIEQNALLLSEAILDNERIINDPETNDLLQQQLQITTNISNDPRQANRQIREAVIIGSQLQDRIERLEPNENGIVRAVAQLNSRYLKNAVGTFFLGAAAVTMCVGIAYLAPIVISVLKGASTPASDEAVDTAPVAIAVDKRRSS